MNRSKLKTDWNSCFFGYAAPERFSRILPFLTCLAIVLASGCLHPHPPTDPEDRTTRDYSYVIAIPALDEDSIRITFTTNRETDFLLPFHYFDNPVDLCEGPTIRDLVVTDATGEDVAFGTDSVTAGPVTTYRLLLPDDIDYPVTMEYHLDLSVVHPDSTRLTLPEVHITNESLLLFGAHMFILPDIGSSRTELWRSPCPVEIHVSVADAIPLYGIPGSTFTCNTLYELLFIQLSAGQQPLSTGHGGGVDFVFINNADTTYPVSVIDSLSQQFSRILDTLATSFGTFTGEPYTVGFLPTWGGLEGSFSFMAGVPSNNIGSSFPEILAHEALHHFIGIRCGEFDDPWWKESAATYLSLMTMIRMQFYHPADIKKRMTTRFIYADTTLFQHALSDPWLRENMFTDLVHGIVYERGAQVMMLLDVAIRLGSENRSSLLTVTAELCRMFEGGAFHRSDFLAALEKSGMNNVTDFFERYVDDPLGCPDSLTLNAAFAKLDSLSGYSDRSGFSDPAAARADVVTVPSVQRHEHVPPKQ
ncbi:MAG: hypothetical protein JW863_00365 [Chitinispirillaceae bacterium]|nr:hypothetical protein [Chitinispirillaceae bacterium]